jgi:hypothetical protein
MVPFPFKVGASLSFIGFMFVVVAAFIQEFGKSALVQGVGNTPFYADCFGFSGLGLWAVAAAFFVYGVMELLWSHD